MLKRLRIFIATLLIRMAIAVLPAKHRLVPEGKEDIQVRKLIDDVGSFLKKHPRLLSGATEPIEHGHSKPVGVLDVVVGAGPIRQPDSFLERRADPFEEEISNAIIDVLKNEQADERPIIDGELEGDE